MLPRPVAPITGQTLSSYLPRLARTNHLTLTEVLATLPPWFSTKINNPDELSQHHMLVPATTDALSASHRPPYRDLPSEEETNQRQARAPAYTTKERRGHAHRSASRQRRR